MRNGNVALQKERLSNPWSTFLEVSEERNYCSRVMERCVRLRHENQMEEEEEKNHSLAKMAIKLDVALHGRKNHNPEP